MVAETLGRVKWMKGGLLYLPIKYNNCVRVCVRECQTDTDPGINEHRRWIVEIAFKATVSRYISGS